MSQHVAVSRVRYPGLPGDEWHERASRLHNGYGAMLSFEIAGSPEAAEAVCERVRLICHATSLGGVESLIERRARYAIDAANGAPLNLVRLSVASSTSMTSGPTWNKPWPTSSPPHPPIEELAAA